MPDVEVVGTVTELCFRIVPGQTTMLSANAGGPALQFKRKSREVPSGFYLQLDQWPEAPTQSKPLRCYATHSECRVGDRVVYAESDTGRSSVKPAPQQGSSYLRSLQRANADQRQTLEALRRQRAAERKKASDEAFKRSIRIWAAVLLMTSVVLLMWLLR